MYFVFDDKFPAHYTAVRNWRNDSSEYVEENFKNSLKNSLKNKGIFHFDRPDKESVTLYVNFKRSSLISSFPSVSKTIINYKIKSRHSTSVSQVTSSGLDG